LSEQTELFKSGKEGTENAMTETNASTHFEALTLKKGDLEDSQANKTTAEAL